ncbi:MAG: lipid II:glycine glycyltransferase FemX, partial [Ktedonobacteraceae bacterium]
MAQISLTHPQWNTFVEQTTRDSTFYFSQAWLDLLARLYGYSVITLISTNSSSHIRGFLPLCFMQSPFTGRRLVSLPFSDYCPLLSVDECSANDLIDQAIELAQQKKARYLELRTGECQALSRRNDLVEEQLYVRWLLQLTSDSDALWSNLRKPVQHQIKKSQKLGVQIRLASNREEMDYYYRLHLQTRCKKHGMPAQPQAFFFDLWDTFAEQGTVKLLLAEYQGNVIASMILFASGTTVRYAYGASNDQYLHLAPNNLLLWTAISWAGTHGYQTLDLGRTACENEGLMEFKRRWGAIKVPLPYYYYPCTAGLASTSEHSWKFHLLTSCWRKLPLL